MGRIPGSNPAQISTHTVEFRSVTIQGYSTVQYNNTQWVPLADFTVKLAYWCIARHKWGNPMPIGQIRWKERGVTADWPAAWSNVRSDTISKQQAERAYKLMHRVGPATSALCGLRDCSCGHAQANMSHGVFECPVAARAWAVVERWWVKLGGTSSTAHAIHKLTVTDREREVEVGVGVWRLLCACMVDCLWVSWTAWVHQGKTRTTMGILAEWEAKVWERVGMLWNRAVRLNDDYDRHIDYVPGCVWSQPRVNHVAEFIGQWNGPLGRVVGGNWVPSRLV